jgi:Glycosyl hydrolases family 32 N-terminal domain
MWECPDFFPIGERWFLVVSEMVGQTTANVAYVEGAIEGEGFRPHRSGRLDSGTRWYAPQSFTVPGGERVTLGWLRERERELPENERGRVGVMSLPRRFFGAPGGGLGMAPFKGLDELRTSPFAHTGVAGGAIVLVAPRACTALEVEVAGDGGVPFVIDLLDEEAGLVVRGTVSGEAIELGVEPWSLVRAEALTPSANESHQRVHFFYDSGICELFTSSGLARSEIFYGRRPARQVAVRSITQRETLGENGGVRALHAWELANIW